MMSGLELEGMVFYSTYPSPTLLTPNLLPSNSIITLTLKNINISYICDCNSRISCQKWHFRALKSIPRERAWSITLG
jgi:hypothetical protein